MTVFNAKNKKHHTKAKMFLDANGGPNIQRFDVVKYKQFEKLTEKQRNFLRPIIEKEALAWAVEAVSNKEIDKVNILNASFLAMNRAVQKLKLVPEHLLIDGNRFRTKSKIPFTCMIKGDGRFFSIAAASVLAKTYRDDYMANIHEQFPRYGWTQNKGYPTKKHRLAIKEFGITKYHRKTFRLLNEQLELNFL